MKQAHFRFYAELNDFLPPSRQHVTFVHGFELGGSVKDMIEALGVPHPEVALILVNGQPVDFSRKVQDGDMISVYPLWHSLEVVGDARVPDAPNLPQPRFVLDTHLGRLAAYLRMLGFDTLYHNDSCDEDLAQTSSREDRILLTRDRGLLKRSVITHGYYVRETEPRRQLAEVVFRFQLAAASDPWRRCLRCNGLLQPAEKKSIHDRIPEKTRQHYEDFWTCPDCDRVYWKGSHYTRMRQIMEHMLAAARR